MMQIRRMVGVASAVAMTAGALGLASTPAQADQPTGTVVTWSGDSSSPVAIESGRYQGPWAQLGGPGMDAEGGAAAIRADGTLDVIATHKASPNAAAFDVPKAVTSQRTLSFSAYFRTALYAVTEDGTLHKWGGSRSTFPDRSWTTEELGGKAIQVAALRYRAFVLVKKADGTTNLVTVVGAQDGYLAPGVYQSGPQIPDDLVSISQAKYRNGSTEFVLAGLRANGALIGYVENEGTSTDAARYAAATTVVPATDPVVAYGAALRDNEPNTEGSNQVDVGSGVAITASGKAVGYRFGRTNPSSWTNDPGNSIKWANNTWTDGNFPTLPAGEAIKEVNSTGDSFSGSTQYALTDKGTVVGWKSQADGGTAGGSTAVGLPDAMSHGGVLDIADGRYALVEGPATAPLDVTTAAKISGTAEVGQSLTGTPAVFNDSSATVTNQWLADGEVIADQTGTSLTLGESQLGKKISFRSTATRGSETKSSTSEQTAAVAAAQAATSTTTISAPSKTYGSSGTVTVTVTSSKTPTGSVTLAGVGANRTAAVQDGKAVFTLPRTTGARRYALTATYTSSTAQVSGSTAKGTFTVTKAKTKRPSAKFSKKPTRKKAGKATVQVTRPSSALAYASGKVKVVITKGRTTKTITVSLSRGARSVTIPKLSKGTWKVTVKYLGDANYVAQSSPSYTIKVK